jgi:hypothetical protein
MSETKCMVVFQTTINGQLAQCEIDCDPVKIHQSREARKDAENLARLAFANLHPAFEKTQPIKAVDVVTYTPPEDAEPDAPVINRATCIYCGYVWTEILGVRRVEIDVHSCRECHVFGVVGDEVRYIGDARKVPGRPAGHADTVLTRGQIYRVEKVVQWQHGRDIKLSGVSGLHDCMLFAQPKANARK